MPTFRSLNVRDSPGLLWAFCEHLHGNVLLSLEGDLSGLGLMELPSASNVETATLKRQTAEPELDFCVIPVNIETLCTLKKKLALAGILGRNGQIIHVQIAKDNQLMLIACDNFHPECTVAADSVATAFLQGLVQHGVLRSYHSG